MDSPLTPTQARQLRRQKESDRAAGQAERNRKARNARKRSKARFNREKATIYKQAETERLRRKAMTKKERKREDISKGLRPKMPWYGSIAVAAESFKRLFRKKK